MPSPANLVHMQSASTGTGNLTVAAVNGKQSFGTAFGTGSTTDVFDYFISNQSAAEWERGTGHMSSSTTLVRDTVIESTNSNSAVNFSAGTKDITNDVPAAKQVTTDTTQTLTNKTLTNAIVGTQVASDNSTKAASTAHAYGLVSVSPPRSLLLNTRFKTWQRGASFSGAASAGVFHADRWIGKFSDSGSSATYTQNNAFHGGLKVVFSNTVTNEYFYQRQYVPGVMNFSGKTLTAVVDVETTETTLTYDFYCDAKWNDTDRINVIDTNQFTLPSGRNLIRYTFDVPDLTGYSYTPDIKNSLEFAFRVVTTTAMTSKQYIVHSIDLYEGIGDFLPSFCDPNFEQQQLYTFYENIPFIAPFVGLSASSGQKRVFFPFTAIKRLGGSTVITYQDGAGNSNKVSTYDINGTRTDNVAPAVVTVQANGVMFILSASTACGIGAALQANADWF
jgi:hypothetical protein